MIDYKLANSLAAEALKLWGAGQLEAAAERYASAVAITEGGETPAAYFHSALAGVLQQLGRHREALVQYEKALAAELATGGAETDSSVKLARYFLADHLTQRGDPSKALEVLAPALSAWPDDWLVRTAQALALSALGHGAEARVAAEHAVANASSESKRAELTELLSAVLAAGKGDFK
jgi:tetratricopeptide (TPR) repeat protein